jgi:hypothetical protein
VAVDRILDGRLWLVAVAVRVVAVLVLAAGPWTDEPAELAGWDAERFQAIAERDGAAWVDQPVEYPPGSVVLFDVLAGDDVVATNRALIAVSALVEIAAVVTLWRRFGPRPAKAFLLIGLPLVPMGYLRLDMVVTGLAIGAAAALLPRSGAGLDGGAEVDSGAELEAGAGLDAAPGPDGGGDQPGAISVGDLAFAGLAAAGAMIKIWPALLVVAAIAVGRVRAAVVALGAMRCSGLGGSVSPGPGWNRSTRCCRCGGPPAGTSRASPARWLRCLVTSRLGWS